jgi:hypothetical protein
MWTALDIFIGLALCYALVSLFCTVIQEFIAQMLDSRGKLLVRALVSIDFEKLVEKLGTNFLANPGWLGTVLSPTTQKKNIENQTNLSNDAKENDASAGKKLQARLADFFQSRRLMADMTPESLAKTISSEMGLIKDGASQLTSDQAILSLLIPAGLKARLRALSDAARKDVDSVKAEVEKWCSDFLDEVNHWFTRRAQIVSLLIGFAAALALNVDTIELATTLKNDPVAREAAVKAAGKLVAEGKLHDCPEFKGAEKPPGLPKVEKTDFDYAKTCLASIQSTYPIPLGWGSVVAAYKEQKALAAQEAQKAQKAQEEKEKEACTAKAAQKEREECEAQREQKGQKALKSDSDGKSGGRAEVLCAIVHAIGLTKLLGILITAIALSLGSRFWFDTLKSLLALRTGGQPTAETK